MNFCKHNDNFDIAYNREVNFKTTEIKIKPENKMIIFSQKTNPE